ncbi:nicotinamide mononucleotide permease [Xylariaceae sp. FL0594]|nr:nicotinamide mononucleotide permease [Xylariaceae sp. FL0594]
MPETLSSLSPDELEKLGRRATRKLDAVVMPILMTMYTLNFLDRQNISSAKLAGLEDDLGLSDVQYQTALSILFVGYIIFQVPSNLIAGKSRWPGTYICAGMAVWGVISASVSVVHDFRGLFVVRFLLGVVEATFFPGALFLLSQFYTRTQYALRTALLYCGSQIGNAIGGLFAIVVLRLDGQRGLSGWRWLFLIEGTLTTALALLFSLFLPNTPKKKILGLSALEHDYIRWSYAHDIGQEDDSEELTGLCGLRLALADPKTWLLTGSLYTTFTFGGVVNFFPTVVRGLGYDLTTTYALTAPPFVLSMAIMLLNGRHSDAVSERFYHVLFPLCLGFAANIIALSTLDVGARYFAILLLPASTFSAAVIILSWITSTLAQPRAKRAAALGLINAICNTSNAWTPFLFFDDGNAPRYPVALAVFIAATVISAAFALATRTYLRSLNTKLDAGEDVGRHGPTARQVASGFRYTL